MRKFGSGFSAALISLLMAQPALSQEIADTIYSGGPILTIDDAAPRAEAVAVRDGRILAVGDLTDVMNHQGDGTKLYDLDGNTLLPGFVDSHGHVVFGGLQALSANLLAAPDGTVNDIASLQDALRDWMAKNHDVIQQVNLIIGFGYDNAQLAELRHPTRDDLDAVSKDVPIMIVHQSGHIGVANSKTLELAGITDDSTPPPGGVYQRDGNGRVTGVLEEYAFFQALFPLLGNLGPDGFKEFAKAGAQMWASFGYTTGQDGRSSGEAVEALKAVAATGDLPIDVAAYPDVLEARDYIKAHHSHSYDNGVRVAGCKLTIDGSPQGFTALRDRPYYDPVGDYPPGYKGYSAVTMDQVQDAVNWCFENKIQILTHSNGEGASDMLIGAIGAAQENFGHRDDRPVVVHGQFLREDQVDSFQALGAFFSLFPMHTFYWGDWHRDHTVGPINAENISPTGWLRQRGLPFGSHHDAPVAFPDSMRILSATVTRRTRSGDILGPHQRVDVMTGLKALTIWPAYQHFEEDHKGSIEVGKLADFAILSEDPTAIDPETLADIDIVATIKEDVEIYRAEKGKSETRLYPPLGHHILDMGLNAMQGG
ncbi:amidohydrolase [Shimia biformata]|uniref:amidohydrolase n=1 Tax=Shimia biformata TaxID=1294299 RepID=UPI00194DCDF6|nr:amidohydrolase [Shimia biformata]